MPSFRLVFPLLIALAGAAHGASQMWEWTVDDGSGPKRHITDMPPPPNLKNVKILRRPAGSNAASAPAPAPTAMASQAPNAPAQAASGNLPPVPAEDKDLTARKKQAEAAEAAKEQQAKQAQAKVRADNCARAQAAKTTLDSGIRVATVKPNGEREVLDDAGRAAEMQRAQAAIASNCGG